MFCFAFGKKMIFDARMLKGLAELLQPNEGVKDIKRQRRINLVWPC
jgi:hypothetical protein